MDDLNVNQSGISPIDLEYLRNLYGLTGEKDLIDILLDSTIAQSPEQAMLILYTMGIPILPKPEEDGGFSWTVSPAAVGAVIATGLAEIGNEMWDHYLDYLAEQKERIKDYLNSPQCREKAELKSPAYLTYVEQHSLIPSNAGYQDWVNNLPPIERNEEKNRVDTEINHAGQLWNGIIDSTAQFVSDNHTDHPEAAAFIVASFLITSSYIGDYLNIVDVASTDMVAVNPIQNSAAAILPLVPETVQAQATLVINFFAIGLLAYSNAEAISTSMKGGEPAADRDAVLAFAKNVVDKVEGNEVNYFLMALLVGSVGKGELTPQQIQEITRAVKAAMIAVALAALYKFETGEISEQEFRDLLDGKMAPRSELEKQLVELLQGLFAEGLQESDGNGEGLWNMVKDALVAFIMSKPSVEDLVNPTTIWTRIGTHLYNPHQQG